MDVEASRAIRQAEVGAAKTMIERTEERVRAEARAPCGGYSLRLGAHTQLARPREGDRAAHSGHRQVQTRGRDLLTRRFHLRQGPRPLHLSSWRASEDNGYRLLSAKRFNVTSRATTRISSRPEASRPRVMCVEVDAVIMTTMTGGSNAGLAREQAAPVAHDVTEAEKFRFVNSPTLLRRSGTHCKKCPMLGILKWDHFGC